ncbi:MAG: thioredoxin fold domain-containing protein [Phycisphaerae bacterium]|nr:thioredoxin fold domain-containing protein [Phycisphaerae bacterium]
MTQGSCSSKEQQLGNVPHLATMAEFDEKVLKSPRPVLVDFYSDGCPPCRKLAPTISKFKDEYEGKADVFKVKVREVAELARRHEIRNIPTVMLFDKGEIVRKWIGLKDESTYHKAIDEALSKREGSTK